jgi:TolB protein
MAADGTNQIRLTTSPGNITNEMPRWSPDGSMIAFLTDRNAPGFNLDIYIMKPDGSGLKRITNQSAIYGDFNWSPDSKEIAFAKSGNPVSDIFVVDVQTGAVGNWTDQMRKPQAQRGRVDHPAWSPDGSTIAFWSSAPINGRLSQNIWIMNASDGGGQRNLTDLGVGTRIGHPVWSPGGSMIAFSSTNDTDGDTDLYVMNADGTGRRNLTAGPPRYDTQPTWSPDGARIAYFGMVQPQGRPQFAVYVVNVGGGPVTVTKLPTSPASDGGEIYGGPVWRRTRR